jgi:MSHA biogenesis protein MshN
VSLVNDLLIEAERRRVGQRAPRPTRLDDLVPTRERSGRPPARLRSRRAWLGLASGVAFALLAVVAAALLGSLVSAPGHRLPLSSESPPPVAARVADRAPTASPDSAAQAVTVRRPVRVESISLERLPGLTRLRIVTDARATHRLELDPDGVRLDLVLANAALVEPTAAIELLDTPIRTLDLQSEPPDLRLALDLDAEVHTQTRWLELARGAALILDLQSLPVAASDAPVELAPLASDSSSRLAPVGAPPSDPSPESIIAAVEPVTRASVDRVYSPDLGDPAALRIERSRGDREREERSARREQLAGALEAARRARSEGRLDDADTQYAEIALLAPNDRVALVEWSDLLTELGRPQDALALIASARDRAPRDQSLLIAQAALLERSGDIDAAIALLDGSGLALTEAPDIHALAAAYQQRAGNHETAIDRYEQILRRFPEESRGWMGLGISLEAVGREHEARDVYRIALRVGELPGSSRQWVTGRLAALGEKD